MPERVLIAAVLIAAGLGAYALGTRWQVRRAGRRGEQGDPLLGALRPRVPAIIYFWSETCAPCKLVQRPALERLQADLGPDGVQVIAVDALERPELADGWGVLSVPTTFVLDASGRPRHVNHGVARAEQLKQQIERLHSGVPREAAYN